LHAKAPHRAQRAHVRKPRVHSSQAHMGTDKAHLQRIRSTHVCAALASQQQLHISACLHTSQHLTNAEAAAEPPSPVVTLAAVGPCALGSHARQRMHEHAAPDARHQRVLLPRAHALRAAHLRAPLRLCSHSASVCFARRQRAPALLQDLTTAGKKAASHMHVRASPHDPGWLKALRAQT